VVAAGAAAAADVAAAAEAAEGEAEAPLASMLVSFWDSGIFAAALPNRFQVFMSTHVRQGLPSFIGIF
jgi:hypothetical protein